MPPADLNAADLNAAEIGSLSEIEHRRWAADRIVRGWRWGPMRDNRQRRHPDLVPYAALTEDTRAKDCAAIRALPEVLAIANLRIANIPPANIPPANTPTAGA